MCLTFDFAVGGDQHTAVPQKRRLRLIPDSLCHARLEPMSGGENKATAEKYLQCTRYFRSSYMTPWAFLVKLVEGDGPVFYGFFVWYCVILFFK